MNYCIYEINDLSDQQIIEILKTGISKDMFKKENLLENYLYEHRDKPANLFYILENGRYSAGKYFIVTDYNNNFVASAGWNHYTDDIALLLTRMIVHPTYRTQYIIGKEVLPLMIEQTKNYKKLWITANDYNKSIYDWFDRSYQGKSTALFNNWPEIYKKFKPIGQRTVNHVLQWVVEMEK